MASRSGPRPEVIEDHGLRFVIDKVERRRLLRVKLELPVKEPETANAESAQVAR